MAIGDDFSVSINGSAYDIRHVSGLSTYTVLELHRWLGDLMDDQQASGDDQVDITTPTLSDRATDQIITLTNGANIDDDAAQYFYGGSIEQDNGDTVYSGLQVLGAVNNSDTQIEIVQDGALYDNSNSPGPFWGTQSAGGLNGNSAAGILFRILVKTRVGGADIDGQRVRVQARHWGDAYDFFNVALGTSESVAAIGTTSDAQNDTDQATVTAYSHVTNTEGFQLLDLNNGNGQREYYSQWTYGADTSGDGLKGMWEYIKDLTGNGTFKTIHGLNGEFFLGITHSWFFDQNGSPSFVENEKVVWGTSFTTDALGSPSFVEGEYVTIGASGAAGKLVRYRELTASTADMVVALENTSITLLDDDVITGLTSGGTAAINGAITANGSSGGEGILLALDEEVSPADAGAMYIQLVSGAAPVNDLQVQGGTSNGTCVVDGTPTIRTVPKIFLGSYTGTLIGAYGIGVLPSDLSASDTVEDLSGATQTPPNNVTFSVTGLISGQDYVLVGPRSGALLDREQDTLNGTLTDNVTASAVTTGAVPSDTPTSGTIRIQDDNGIYVRTPYDSYTGSTFTLSAAYQGSDNANATTGNFVFISYIDKLSAAATESFTSVFSSTRDLFVRVRDGGATPIKTFEGTGSQLTSTGGTIAVIRTTDA